MAGRNRLVTNSKLMIIVSILYVVAKVFCVHMSSIEIVVCTVITCISPQTYTNSSCTVQQPSLRILCEVFKKYLFFHRLISLYLINCSSKSLLNHDAVGWLEFLVCMNCCCQGKTTFLLHIYWYYCRELTGTPLLGLIYPLVVFLMTALIVLLVIKNSVEVTKAILIDLSKT